MKKILVVEDSDIALKNVEGALSSTFELKVAKSLKEARSKIGNNQFDLFLFDIVLPDGNGFDFYIELVDLGHNRCPVIFFSTHRDRENILMGMELGQCDYIFKPFNHDELLVRVETQIAIHEKREKELIREKAELSEEFSHEINNPLASIQLALRALIKEYNIQDSKYLDILERNIARLHQKTIAYKMEK